MIDKLHMKYEGSIELEKVKTILKCHTCRKVRDTLYKECYVFQCQGSQNLTIKTDPIWSNISHTHLQINPSQWGDLFSLKKILQGFVRSEDLYIIRIDHAVDIEMPIEDFYFHTRVKSKRNSRECKVVSNFKGSTMTGFYIGQSPKVYCFYDKGYQLIGLSKYKRKKEFKIGELTRIEVRESRKKIKYAHFLDLPMYLHHNPFENLEYYNLIKLEKGTERKLDNLRRLNASIQKNGFNRTYQMENKYNNFTRDSQNFFTKQPMANHLLEIYRGNLRQFFNE